MLRTGSTSYAPVQSALSTWLHSTHYFWHLIPTQQHIISSAPSWSIHNKLRNNNCSHGTDLMYQIKTIWKIKPVIFSPNPIIPVEMPDNDNYLDEIEDTKLNRKIIDVIGKIYKELKKKTQRNSSMKLRRKWLRRLGTWVMSKKKQTEDWWKLQSQSNIW